MTLKNEFCRHVTLVIFMTTGSHVTTRKLQFAEEGPTLRVESYAVFEDFTLVLTCNKIYNEFCI